MYGEIQNEVFTKITFVVLSAVIYLSKQEQNPMISGRYTFFLGYLYAP